MTELHRETDKFLDEVNHLERLLESVDERPNRLTAELALAQAKRVRRSSNMLVRAIARIRDSYSRGGTS